MDSRIQLTSIDVIASALEPVMPSLERVSSPDGAITLMLSDIANAAAAASELGPERWQRLLDDHRLMVEQTISHHGGTIGKFERDGFFASFNSAHSGLHAAVELQKTFAGTSVANGQGLAVRVGLHSGFVISNPGQMMGRNVVLASRIAAQAGAGEILVSSTLKQYTETDPSFEFEERGEYHFKGLHGEHLVYRVRWS
jgi:class 3 adenylate cyclase